MTIREAIKENDIEFKGDKRSFFIGFNNGDETSLDASSLEELEELWESLVDEFETEIDKVDYVEMECKRYKARVAFFETWCRGTINTYGVSPEDAYDTAVEEVGKVLYDAFPDLDIEYQIEIIEEE